MSAEAIPVDEIANRIRAEIEQVKQKVQQSGAVQTQRTANLLGHPAVDAVLRVGGTAVGGFLLFEATKAVLNRAIQDELVRYAVAGIAGAVYIAGGVYLRKYSKPVGNVAIIGGTFSVLYAGYNLFKTLSKR